ncbi:MAG: hypothetical protein H6720_22800 [Sandaracinus sp.]|nr:hypothetical protein [Sandaracinus sp.]
MRRFTSRTSSVAVPLDRITMEADGGWETGSYDFARFVAYRSAGVTHLDGLVVVGHRVVRVRDGVPNELPAAGRELVQPVATVTRSMTHVVVLDQNGLGLFAGSEDAAAEGIATAFYLQAMVAPQVGVRLDLEEVQLLDYAINLASASSQFEMLGLFRDNAPTTLSGRASLGAVFLVTGTEPFGRMVTATFTGTACNSTARYGMTSDATPDDWPMLLVRNTALLLNGGTSSCTDHLLCTSFTPAAATNLPLFGSAARMDVASFLAGASCVSTL